MIKLLHCADIHLDSPFAAECIDRAEVRRAELRGAFTSMMTYVKMNHIDILLIAGDMFDREFVTLETMALVAREFASAPECEIVISPGNHDPYTENGAWAKCKFSDNVHIFTSTALSFFSFERLNCEVYGYAFTGPDLELCPAAGRKPRRHDCVNILLAHADMSSPHSTNAPINEQDIADSGFDYVALGHIHASGGAKCVRNTHYAYSGCLEGRDFGECGHKGALAITADKPNGVFSCDIKGVRFSRRRYADERLNLTGITDRSALLDAIRRFISEKKFGEDTLLRLTLEGSVAPSLEISPRVISSQIEGLFSLEIVDATSPTFDIASLERDLSIKGAFWAELKGKITASDEYERQTASAALRYGLAALSGADIADFE